MTKTPPKAPPKTPLPLVVDLDDTLVKTDMVFEAQCDAMARDWRTFFHGARLSRGPKQVLKRYLTDVSDIDVTTLPYNTQVLDLIRDWRETGAEVILATATDDRLARKIADHLGLFDDVLGTTKDVNLKGQSKADALVSRYGARGFAYAGDSATDLPVWSQAGIAITVNAPPALRNRAEGAAPEAVHIGTKGRATQPYLRALRPHQWLKNLLVFLPMLAAHQLTGAAFLTSFLAFVSFSLIASSVYVLNDLIDLGADRAHPRKKLRPFAAGEVPLTHGATMLVALAGAGLALALFIGPTFALAMVLYAILTTAYSLALKRKPVIDICVLAALYTLRILAGGAATDIPLSVWLLAFSMFFFLALAAVKRQAELVDMVAEDSTSSRGRGYQVEDLPLVSMMALAAGYTSVLVMALYLNSAAVQVLYSEPGVLWGICGILLYWISRTVFKAHRGLMHDDPVVFATKDGVSLACGALILVFGVSAALF